MTEPQRVRISPTVQSAWATPTQLRFGIDRELATLENPSSKVQRFLDALRTGMPLNRMPAVARALGVNEVERQRLIDQLEPVLEYSAAAEPGPEPRLRVHIPDQQRTGPALANIRTSIHAAGHSMVEPKDARVAILTAHLVMPLPLTRPWANRGIPFLPIVFGEHTVRIGPVLGRDGGPCAYCEHLANIDMNPHWIALASQCLGRRTMTDTGSLAPFVAGHTLELLEAFARGATPHHRIMLAQAREGGAHAITVTREVLASHPKCVCQQVD